jgi:hypothetical protein
VLLSSQGGVKQAKGMLSDDSISDSFSILSASNSQTEKIKDLSGTRFDSCKYYIDFESAGVFSLPRKCSKNSSWIFTFVYTPGSSKIFELRKYADFELL